MKGIELRFFSYCKETCNIFFVFIEFVYIFVYIFALNDQYYCTALCIRGSTVMADGWGLLSFASSSRGREFVVKKLRKNPSFKRCTVVALYKACSPKVVYNNKVLWPSFHIFMHVDVHFMPLIDDRKQRFPQKLT